MKIQPIVSSQTLISGVALKNVGQPACFVRSMHDQKDRGWRLGGEILQDVNEGGQPPGTCTDADDVTAAHSASSALPQLQCRDAGLLALSAKPPPPAWA